ncbi:acyl-CoA dehydrogenase family protein [Halomonas urumqiensis]|uniref:Acyl-CoA dehydrogenase n=1 Tax=Halomonas urumqiensis TaxID=1684789 RepID=A0A2N7UEK5_9GAMM|nr:acyl-CoA dehydrogenase [Halomonas urumqiensis]PMR78850.1 acyl-CoA dehydrogenase [Halomonas urumqiensis]PTB04245.1 acyl-CoA dehydrogenase [Halomonas urumqiensis]GHE19480.1 pimeloyl-CoA dehydrogenase small subunit [Halomonas urumqiensis]
MDFSLSDEQRMLADTLDRLMADRVSPEQRRTMLEAPAGARSPLWQTFAELGLLHMPFTEEVGGLGGDGTDLMIIMQALGRGLVPEPYLAGLVLPGELLARLGDAEQRERWLTPLLEGEHQLALAWQENDARYDAHGISTTARRDGDGWRLDGHKQLVFNAASALAMLVTARLDDGRLGLFVVPADTTGLSRHDYRTIDDQLASDLTLDAIALTNDACLGLDAAQALDATQALGRAALCAEAVGAMEVACQQTLDYLKERRQFGTPLSAFQSLQHRMVDMHLHLEQARSMAILATTSLALADNERDYRIAAAKAYCGEAARFIAEQAIQLHGGMGMTEECYVSHYAKRLVMFDHYLGDVDHHLEYVSDHLLNVA